MNSLGFLQGKKISTYLLYPLWGLITMFAIHIQQSRAVTNYLPPIYFEESGQDSQQPPYALYLEKGSHRGDQEQKTKYYKHGLLLSAPNDHSALPNQKTVALTTKTDDTQHTTTQVIAVSAKKHREWKNIYILTLYMRNDDYNMYEFQTSSFAMSPPPRTYSPTYLSYTSLAVSDEVYKSMCGQSQETSPSTERPTLFFDIEEGESLLLAENQCGHFTKDDDFFTSSDTRPKSIWKIHSDQRTGMIQGQSRSQSIPGHEITSSYPISRPFAYTQFSKATPEDLQAMKKRSSKSYQPLSPSTRAASSIYSEATPIIGQTPPTSSRTEASAMRTVGKDLIAEYEQVRCNDGITSRPRPRAMSYNSDPLPVSTSHPGSALSHSYPRSMKSLTSPVPIPPPKGSSPHSQSNSPYSHGFINTFDTMSMSSSSSFQSSQAGMPLWEETYLEGSRLSSDSPALCNLKFLQAIAFSLFSINTASDQPEWIVNVISKLFLKESRKLRLRHLPTGLQVNSEKLLQPPIEDAMLHSIIDRLFLFFNKDAQMLTKWLNYIRGRKKTVENLTTNFDHPDNDIDPMQVCDAVQSATRLFSHTLSHPDHAAYRKDHIHAEVYMSPDRLARTKERIEKLGRLCQNPQAISNNLMIEGKWRNTVCETHKLVLRVNSYIPYIFLAYFLDEFDNPNSESLTSYGTIARMAKPVPISTSSHPQLILNPLLEYLYSIDNAALPEWALTLMLKLHSKPLPPQFKVDTSSMRITHDMVQQIDNVHSQLMWWHSLSRKQKQLPFQIKRVASAIREVREAASQLHWVPNPSIPCKVGVPKVINYFQGHLPVHGREELSQYHKPDKSIFKGSSKEEREEKAIQTLDTLKNFAVSLFPEFVASIGMGISKGI